MLQQHKQQPDRGGPNPEGVAAEAGAVGAAAGDSLLHFDPARAVSGITFHLVDEGLARGVTPDSARRAVARLRRRAVRPSIGRGEWAAMTHRGRLHWLLTQTRTGLRLRSEDAARVDEAVVILTDASSG